MVDNFFYVVVFFFGGYGVLLNFFESEEVKDIFNWVMINDKKVVIFCYGFVVLLVVIFNDGDFFFDGYEMIVFLDSLDEGVN